MVLSVKDLARLINLSLPVGGKILSRVVLYILQNSVIGKG
jgi:hypothetical protein